MNIARHYEDEALIQLMEEDRHGADEHLPSCPECTGKVESFRMLAETLHESDVWDTSEHAEGPVPSTIANLRAFADRMSHEDTQAALILKDLLAGPREEWMPRLEQHPEWRTAGVVRKLVEEFVSVIMTMPPDALEMTALSTEIADHLDATAFASDTVARLRGSAWRNLAYALFYVGRYPESLTAADRADRHFSGCMVDEYDRARVAVVRALSLRAMDQIAQAMLEVRSSADTFARFNDLTRFSSASLAEVSLLFAKGEYEQARVILEPLERRVRATADADTHARLVANLAHCDWKTGRIDSALRHYELSAAINRELGNFTEVTRIGWAMALILSEAGRHDEALLRYEKVGLTFSELGMTSEATLVSLDIAELLILRQDFSTVVRLCHAAMRSFEEAGLTYTPRALTALAFLKEAAAARAATPLQVRHVREYLSVLPRNGQLLFAPPPLEAPSPSSR